jgi:hypothetical protein
MAWAARSVIRMLPVVVITLAGCEPETQDPLQSSRDAWKQQRSDHRAAVQDAQKQASDLMRELGVGQRSR